MRCCLCDEGLSGLPESIEPPQRQPSPVEIVESQIPMRAAFFIRLLLEFSFDSYFILKYMRHIMPSNQLTLAGIVRALAINRISALHLRYHKMSECTTRTPTVRMGQQLYEGSGGGPPASWEYYAQNTCGRSIGRGRGRGTGHGQYGRGNSSR